MNDTPIPKPVRLLPEEISNQIAAGEVVERPASVLKELMENSLDAGATRLVIETKSGGRSLIRVMDNGCGMSPDDLIMSLERHATSKLAESGDLEAVATLGFRGEALPSIAAVSKVTLRSRPAGADTGSMVRIHGGVIRQVEEVGCPVGTLVEAAGLFYNTPARRKFLKSRATENGHLAESVLRLALARPGVSFKYTSEGRAAFDLPPVDDIAVRAAALLGRQSVSQMVILDEQCDGFRLTGLAGLPSLTRSAPDQVYAFVNGRYVRDRVILHAVGQAYRGLVPEHRRPVVILRLDMDPAQVDVNVHPAKTEVRFRRQTQLHDGLAQGLRRALGKSRPSGVFDPGSRQRNQPIPERDDNRPPRRELRPPVDDGMRPWPTPADNLVRAPLADPAAAALPTPRPLPAGPPEGARPQPAINARPLFGPAGQLTVIGQLHGLYVLCSSPGGLVIMDQHAAHERLTYQKMKDRQKKGGSPAQGLLSPVSLELTPTESAWAEKQAGDWARLGLVLEPFGHNTWLVTSIPAALAGMDPAPLVRDLLSELQKGGVPVGTPEFLETGLRSLACRASIKSGQRLGPAELQKLADRVSSLPPPVTCPHGRPVLLTITRRELARAFKRSHEGRPDE